MGGEQWRRVPRGGLATLRFAMYATTDWASIASLATAAGTLVLAIATFAAVLYGDHEGGQRTITRFAMLPRQDGSWLATTARHWNVDRPDPR
jgi:hypothetical protein